MTPSASLPARPLPSPVEPPLTATSSLLAVAFSKDRPMQLEATLRSFRRCCQDAAAAPFGVLFKATTPASRAAYAELARAFPDVVFVEERDFKRQLEELLAAADAVLFLVDDNVFVRPFRLRDLLGALAADPSALGVSLRLGRNTTRCYSLDRPQRAPAFDEAPSGLLRYRWPGADCDFGYPLEVSSSIFPTRRLLPLLRSAAYAHPNGLEEALARSAPRFAASHPHLLCAPRSLAFCVPANRVQSTHPNRAGEDAALSAEALLERFARGERIDVAALEGFEPSGCHEEVALRFTGAAPPASAPAPAPALPAANAPRIDLRDLLGYPGRYAVLRLPEEFPAYRDHSDLDVLCDDVEAFRAHLLRAAAPYLARGFRLEEHRDGPHLHVDLFHPGASRLALRFDLSASLPSLFRKVTVDAALTGAVLAERERLERDGAAVYVPKREHDLALRVLEYLEWQDRRPDKVKHLQHVDRANDFSFLDVLNGYTSLWARLDTDRGQARLDLSPKSIAECAALPAIRERPPRKQRMDYFMVWGHGLAHAEAIVDAIRAQPAFRIVTIVKRRVPDVARFVERVYEADTVPLHHLAAKTRYLLTTPGEVLFVLVKNLDPQEQYFGEGAFRHVQCRHVKAVKEEIRERFNPRAGGRRTEDHVIHGSDYEAQVRHLLAVLGLPPLEHYAREPNAEVHAPYHLPPFERFEVRELPLASLRARILGRGDLPIEETPHHRHLAGDPAAYRAYHAAHLGAELTDDHFPAAFDRLRATFDPERTERDGKLDLILATPLGDGTFRIVDGVHRAALLRSLGRTTAKVVLPSWPQQAAAATAPAAAPAPRPGRYEIAAGCQIPNLASLYQLFLGYRTDGTFVEFGAFDGEYVSNTSALADLGWRGVYVEPVPEYFRKCAERHRRNPKVSVLNYAVGDEEGEIEIHVGGPLSTASASSVDKFRSFDWAAGYHRGHKVKARQRLLDGVLAESGIEPGFDLLVVDVEGYEWNALRRFDLARWRPRMLIVELHDANAAYDNEWESCNQLLAHLEPHYRIVYKDYTNTVFVRRDLRQLRG